MPLNDKEKTNQVIVENSGIGYIIAKVDFTYDKSGNLKKWRNKFENRVTEGHMLKLKGKITEIKAVFLDKSGIDLGILDGWIKDFNQGKNSGEAETARKPKYQINIEKIPKRFTIEID